MTDEQHAVIKALSRCTFGVGSYEKRFVRDMAGRPADFALSPRQDWYLRRTHYRYRKQIGKPQMPKPADYDNGPVKETTVAELEHDGADNVAAYLRPSRVERRQARDREKLSAWNEGKPK